MISSYWALRTNYGLSSCITELALPFSKSSPASQHIRNENRTENSKTDNTVGQGETREVAYPQTPTETMGIDDGLGQAVEESGKQTKPAHLTSVHMPVCQSYVLACTSDKRLLVWAQKDRCGSFPTSNQWELHSERKTPRKCVQVRLTGQVPPMILVADRAGDVYEFSLDDSKAPPNLLMGRMSMLLDMALSPSDDFLVVCDRDEKIVVSHYPEAYNIIAFCLGHRRFVTSIELLPNHPNRLVSVSGDGLLILWNLEAGGVQLASANCWAEAQTVDQLLPFEQFHSRKDDQDVRPPLKKVLCQKNLVAVLYYRVPYVHIFRCDGSSLVSCGGVVTEAAVWSAAIDNCLRLWVLTPSLSVFQLDQSGKHYSVNLPSGLTLSMRKALSPLEGVTEVDPDLDVLFKQWFDNVEEYFKRKRRREEIQRRNNIKSTTEKI
ncbi:tRNA (guanine-N(7)-)-methyltransferase non-catalytic subunit WDR4-like isoform X2 [Varroa jacobsoni]|uniref:tRNA (guanine-N(7)-)-methyltransferase non-catalytic subunit WDR4-like isoform X2 n=1 Tax=Varroa jacobsoni TaxID=62625 RepID=UPI000BF9E06A|nr:tRNA (guanine-N(7)-)-methyltransferase non-catalytic subunit WDR4-like isoform X2 [Varroa jacobsoni]